MFCGQLRLVIFNAGCKVRVKMSSEKGPKHIYALSILLSLAFRGHGENKDFKK